MENLDELARLAALASLNKMLKQGHFDICTVRDIGDLFGIPVRNTEEYQILHTVHCVTTEICQSSCVKQFPAWCGKFFSCRPLTILKLQRLKLPKFRLRRLAMILQSGSR